MSLASQRIAAEAERVRGRRVREIAEMVGSELPDAIVDQMSEGLQVDGRHLLKRWLESASLRGLEGARR